MRSFCPRKKAEGRFCEYSSMMASCGASHLYPISIFVNNQKYNEIENPAEIIENDAKIVKHCRDVVRVFHEERPCSPSRHRPPLHEQYQHEEGHTARRGDRCHGGRGHASKSPCKDKPIFPDTHVLLLVLNRLFLRKKYYNIMVNGFIKYFWFHHL